MAIVVVALVFVMVLIVAAVVVGGSVIMFFVRALSRLFFGPPAPNVPVPKPAEWVRCGRPQCHVENPVHAQFCRRCGEPLGKGQEMRIVA